MLKAIHFTSFLSLCYSYSGATSFGGSLDLTAIHSALVPAVIGIRGGRDVEEHDLRPVVGIKTSGRAWDKKLKKYTDYASSCSRVPFSIVSASCLLLIVSMKMRTTSLFFTGSSMKDGRPAVAKGTKKIRMAGGQGGDDIVIVRLDQTLPPNDSFYSSKNLPKSHVPLEEAGRVTIAEIWIGSLRKAECDGRRG